MKYVNLIVISLFIALSSCSPKNKGKIVFGEIVEDMYRNCPYRQVYLKNTSSSKVITFTIKKISSDGEESSTDVYTLAPGYEKFIDWYMTSKCNSIMYEIVGAFYPEKYK